MRWSAASYVRHFWKAKGTKFGWAWYLHSTILTIKDFHICQMTLKPFTFPNPLLFMTLENCWWKDKRLHKYKAKLHVRFFEVENNSFFSWVAYLSFNLTPMIKKVFPSICWIWWRRIWRLLLSNSLITKWLYVVCF